MLLTAFYYYKQLIVSKPKLKKGTKGSVCSTGYPKIYSCSHRLGHNYWQKIVASATEVPVKTAPQTQ